MTAELQRLAIREPGPDDVPALAAHVVAGMDGYRAFQPAGWAPPPLEQEIRRSTPRLADPATWKRMALDDGTVVGQVLFEPARDLPGAAHLANLFVSEDWWGTGLAGHLHGLAVEAMREQGYERARLFTPEQQTRARRFYEREGWRLEGDPAFEAALGMNLVQYRRPLAP